MSIWYLLSIPAWIIILATAGARLADLDRTQWDPVDHAHRIFLIAAATGSAVLLFTPVAEDAKQYIPATWRLALFSWAWAGCWVTKRDLVPWWDFILGVHRTTEEWRTLTLRARARAEARALRDSFKPRRWKSPPMAGPRGPLP